MSSDGRAFRLDVRSCSSLETEDPRVSDLVLLALALLAILPFVSSRLLLSVDVPQHLAVAAIVSAQADPARSLADVYIIDAWPRPYGFATVLLVGLGRFVPLEQAVRVLLCVYAFALIFAVRALVKSGRDRDPRLAWFGAFFVQGWSVAYGFLPFVFALPVLIVGVAIGRRLLDRPTRLFTSCLGGCVALATLFHPLVAALLLVALATLFVVGGSGRHRRCLGLAMGLGVGLAVAISAAESRPPLEAARFVDGDIETHFRLGIKHKVLEYAVAFLPGHLDELVAWPGALALLVSIGLGLVRARRRGQGRAAVRSNELCPDLAKANADPLEWVALILFILYLITPADLSVFGFRVSLLGPRLVVPVWLCAVAAPRGRLPRVVPWLGAASAVASLALVTEAAMRFGAAWGPVVTQAVERIELGARVRPEVMVPLKPALNRAIVSTPELSLHAYMMLGRAQYDPMVFSTPQSPVWIRRDAPRPEDREGFDVVWRQAADPVITLEPVSR